MLRQKILAIGKDEDLLNLLVVLLETRGYEVVIAPDSKVAIELVHETQPGLVLIDVALPRTNDLDLCCCIKGHSTTKHTPVVILETNRNEKARWEAAGADTYVLKPFGSAELLNVVMRLLGDARASNEIVTTSHRRSQEGG